MRKMMMAIIVAVTYTICLTSRAYPADRAKESDMDIINLILQSNELTGLTVHRVDSRSWITGDDLSKRTLKASNTRSMPSIYQEIMYLGVKVRIDYAEFESITEAKQAIRFRVVNVASLFKDGLWNGASNELIGDETLYARDSGTLAVLFRSGKTCVLISCSGVDFEAQSHVAEILAKYLLQKEIKGERIPMSDILH